jgi:predicted hydrolase (HD superfamily)
MRHYAAMLGGDAERWGLAGLLHDVDWEIHPNIAIIREGARSFASRGLDEELITCILSHNTEGTGVRSNQPIDFRAVGVRRGHRVGYCSRTGAARNRDAEVSSVKRSGRKRRSPRSRSAGGREGGLEFSRACFAGIELWEHVKHVLMAMQRRLRRWSWMGEWR